MERRRIGGIPLKWIAGGLGVLLLLSGFLLIRDGLEILRFQEQRLLLASRQVLEVLAAQRMALLGFRKDQLLADGRVMARSPVVEMAVLPLLGGKPSPDSLHFLTRWLELRRRVFHHRGAVLLDAAGHPRLEVGAGCSRRTGWRRFWHGFGEERNPAWWIWEAPRRNPRWSWESP